MAPDIMPTTYTQQDDLVIKLVAVVVNVLSTELDGTAPYECARVQHGNLQHASASEQAAVAGHPPCFQEVSANGQAAMQRTSSLTHLGIDRKPTK